MFNERSCGASFNLLELDLNTSSRNTISFGVPLTEYRDSDGNEISFENRKRIGQIIWEMDLDENFERIYKPVSFEESGSGMIPRLTADHYPVQNDGDSLIGKIPVKEFFNLGIGKLIHKDVRKQDVSDEW